MEKGAEERTKRKGRERDLILRSTNTFLGFSECGGGRSADETLSRGIIRGETAQVRNELIDDVEFDTTIYEGKRGSETEGKKRERKRKVWRGKGLEKGRRRKERCKEEMEK